jgi:hypothetical protein
MRDWRLEMRDQGFEQSPISNLSSLQKEDDGEYQLAHCGYQNQILAPAKT